MMWNILDLNLEELKEVLGNWQKPKFHAHQIFAWIYKKGVSDFERMSNLPQALREKLKKDFYLCGLRIVEKLASKDGTEKFLFGLQDKNLIEAVVIPAEGRFTGCVSVQVGCKFACKFCASSLLGFKRNLSSGEMLEEVLYLKNNSKDKKLTHLVFMGIGEPLDNYDNVMKTIRIINSPYGLNIGARKITISTCGLIPQIAKLANEDLQIELSVSLHSADDKIRIKVMPINKKYPLKGLILACQDYISKTNRQITFEYILIKGLNSDLQSARKLSKIVEELRLCKVNLIPANTIREYNIEPPNKLEILYFRDYLLKQGVNVTLRKPRGQDIEAACGQLRLRHEKK